MRANVSVRLEQARMIVLRLARLSADFSLRAHFERLSRLAAAYH